MITDAEATIEIIKKENNEWYEFNKARQPGFLDLVDMIHTTTDFILELVQNADDAGSKKISVEFTPKRLFFYNDGEPFQEDKNDKTHQNVSALCSVGKSTKISKIGFMGLGFKSVFRVCSKVEVHSNPFHFILDAEKKIVPEWYEPTKKVNKYLNEKPGKGTVFILHLINSKTDINVSLEDVKITVQRLTPDTLIWLNSLEEVIIDEDKFKIYRPEKSFESIKAGENFYKKFESPRKKLHDKEKNDLIKHRKINPKTFNNKPIMKEIGISFKVDKNDYIIPKKEGTCFAFLPLPDVKLGVKFDVQGDFNVDSHRKNILRDVSPLNNWLFAQVGKAWDKAYEYYKEQTDQELSLQMLKLIPLENESPEDCEEDTCNHPFCTIKKSIDSYMTSSKNKMFLTDGNAPMEERWITLKNSFVPEQQEVKDLFELDDLHKIQNRFARWVAPETPKAGIKYIEEKDKNKLVNVYDLITNEKVLDNVRSSSNRMTPEWFARLTMALSEVYDSDEFIRHYNNAYSTKANIIKTFPVLLIDGKTVVRRGAVDEIFYSSLEREKSQTNSEISNFIHPGIIEYLEAETDDLEEQKKRQKALRFLFENKIITEKNTEYYIKNVIVPRFEEFRRNEWKSVKDTEVDKIICELYSNKEMKAYWGDIKNKIPLKGNDGKYHLPNEMYLPLEYGSEFDATTFFSGIQSGGVLSKRYKKLLVKKKQKKKKQSRTQSKLCKFFENLGVKTGIELVGGNEDSISQPDLQTWLHGEIPKKTSIYGWEKYSGYRLIDYDLPPEIKNTLKIIGKLSKEKSHKKCLVFFSELVREWPNFESKANSEYIRFDPRISGKNSRMPESANESSWIRFLSSTISWVPVIGPGGKDCSVVGLAIFPEDYLGEIDNSAGFIISIPNSLMQYYHSNLVLFREFYVKQGWEAKHSIDFEILKLHSLVYSKQKTKQKEKFEESYQCISKLLEKTPHQLRKKKIDILDSSPWIYTPSSTKKKRKKKYRKIAEVKWGEPKKELGDWKIDISLYYPSLKDFFTKQIGIGDIKPTDYLRFTQKVLVGKKNLNKTDMDLLSHCYRKIEAYIQEQNTALIKDIEDKQHNLKFWCYGKKWLTLKNEIFYLDDEEFYKELKKEGIKPNIILVPDSMNPFPYNFFTMVKIKPLSMIRMKPRVHYDSEVSMDTSWIKTGIKEILPDIKMILRKKDVHKYREMDTQGIFDRLRNIQIIPVKNLEIIMDIDIEGADSIKKKKNFVITEDYSLLGYLDETIMGNKNKIKSAVSLELDKMFGELLGRWLFWSLWGTAGEERDLILEEEGVKRSKRKTKKQPDEEDEEPPPITELVPGEKKEVIVGSQQTKEKHKRKKKEGTSQPGSFPRKKMNKPESDRDSWPKKEWSRLEVERKAIEIVIDLENRDEDNEGYKAIDVHQIKLGYDVVVIPHKITIFEYDEESYANVTKKFIEIKASKHDSEDFIITAQEIEKGEKFTDAFFLYRVTDTMSKKPVVYIVDRPLEQYHDAIDEKIVKIVQDWKTKEGLHYIEVPYYPK